MARWPAPGRCKRRLAASIGISRAAAVQARLLLHGLAAAQQAASEGRAAGQAIEVVLAVSGVGPQAGRRWGRALAVQRLVHQGEGSLGLRLQRQVTRARREGIQRLVVVGSDLPQLCSDDLLSAFAALRSAEVVVGPACDGGYWLIGLRPTTPSCRLFAGARHPIPWGSERVLASTLAAAAAVGIQPVLLAERRDLDHALDLAAWR
ncbi:MAG: TIGR04282 family arsenosugar biosynthesis glycosyltransferase [Cyanobacteriota bacterium]|nr:TIGR04282 family arsenosugar biosynthesis glycosyltransferase [Cyanobacteriota bacterium]